jgi:hypothetical protein
MLFDRLSASDTNLSHALSKVAALTDAVRSQEKAQTENSAARSAAQAAREAELNSRLTALETATQAALGKARDAPQITKAEWDAHERVSVGGAEGL